MEHSIDIRMHGVPFRITTTMGTLHFGAGWLEVRPPGGNGLNFCGVSVRAHDDLLECIGRLNRILSKRPGYRDATVTAARLKAKEEVEESHENGNDAGAL